MVLAFDNSDYNTTWPAYYSREYTTSSLRPKLEVTYTPPPATTIETTTSTTTTTTTSTTTTAPTQSSTVIWEDFQAYPLDQWPSANWVADANASDVGNNKVSSAQGGKALQLYGQIGGCWGALAYRAVSFPSKFWVECDVFNGTEALSGCHPGRGGIGMRQGTYWANPARSLLEFTGGDRLTVDGQDIGGYQSGQWAHVKIGYARNGSTLEREYWLNGTYLTKVTSSIADLGAEASLDHIELVVQEGSAWFDNLRVTVEGGTTYCPTGWTWFQWPYEYDYTTSQWWFYRASDTQWCYGFAPVNGWVRLGSSGLASGFVYFSWPYAYDWEGGAWYWFNLGNTQSCANLGTGEWRTLGR